MNATLDTICTGYGDVPEHDAGVALPNALCPSCEAQLDADVRQAREDAHAASTLRSIVGRCPKHGADSHYYDCIYCYGD